MHHSYLNANNAFSKHIAKPKKLMKVCIVEIMNLKAEESDFLNMTCLLCYINYLGMNKHE